jgi:hypothetical protein
VTRKRKGKFSQFYKAPFANDLTPNTEQTKPVAEGPELPPELAGLVNGLARPVRTDVAGLLDGLEERESESDPEL